MLRRHGPFLACFALYATFVVHEVPRYGVTWDAHSEYPRATAYVEAVVSGRTSPSEVPEAERTPWHGHSYEVARQTTDRSVNACLPSVVAALSGKLFFQRLGLLGAMDAYHLGLALLWLACLAYVHVRLVEVHGRWVALAGTAMLALMPRVLAHVPNNMKDLPATAFMTMAVLDVLAALQRDRPWRLPLAGLFLGCAVSSKFTAGIAVVPMALLLLPRLLAPDRARWLVPLATMPLLAFGVLVGHWPYLWVPPAELWERLVGVVTASRMHVPTAPAPTAYPLWMIWATTPPVLLALLLVEAAPGLGPRPGPRRAHLAYAVWLACVVAFWSTGRVRNFDGVRNMLAFAPPAAFLAALGLQRIDCIVGFRRPAWRARGRVVAALAVGACLVLPVARTHPFEVTYFNALVGGLPGARARAAADDPVRFEADDYWGSSLRAAVDWSHAHLPHGAHVTFGTPDHVLRQYAWRADLTTSVHGPAPEGRPRFLVFLDRRNDGSGCERFAREAGTVVHEVAVAGEVLAAVYRLPDGPTPCDEHDVGRPTLTAAAPSLALDATEPLALSIRSGRPFAGDAYSILVSASGRVERYGHWHADPPLAYDDLTLLALRLAPSPPFEAFVGRLDDEGRAEARLGPLLGDAWRESAARELTFVALVRDGRWSYSSDPVVVTLVR